MTFEVQAESYDRFMGRYSMPLAPKLADLAGVRDAQRVLDVGCGPGALTEELVSRLGPESVSAADPSEPFVAAARERHPGVDVHRARAEELPFPDAWFDAALAQLVIHFMSDAAAGVAEMRRVTRDGGVVAGCVWDHGSGRGPLSPFWQAARELEPDVDDESRLVGANEGDLGRLFRASGLRDVEETVLAVNVEHRTFEEWWEPYTLGVGPAGAHVARLDQERRDALRGRCRELLPEPPFVLEARAWAARGLA
jgi:SAM-dependent methyltransferase